MKTANYRDATETLPRGYRNNNPLNIRINPKNSWEGKIISNTDGVFEQFTSMAYGYRAAFVLLRNYVNDGYNTIAAIIGRWAPTNENNTSGYITRVCNYTGFTPNTVVRPDNEEQMCKLAYAMSLVENGSVPAPDMEVIRQGYRMLFFPKSVKTTGGLLLFLIITAVGAYLGYKLA